MIVSSKLVYNTPCCAWGGGSGLSLSLSFSLSLSLCPFSHRHSFTAQNTAQRVPACTYTLAGQGRTHTHTNSSLHPKTNLLKEAKREKGGGGKVGHGEMNHKSNSTNSEAQHTARELHPPLPLLHAHTHTKHTKQEAN